MILLTLIMSFFATLKLQYENLFYLNILLILILKSLIELNIFIIFLAGTILIQLAHFFKLFDQKFKISLSFINYTDND